MENRTKNHMPWLYGHYEMEMNTEHDAQILHELCEKVMLEMDCLFGLDKCWHKERIYKIGWLISEALKIKPKGCNNDFFFRDGDHLAAWVYLYIWAERFVVGLDSSVDYEKLHELPANVNKVMRKAVIFFNYDRRWMQDKVRANLAPEEVFNEED